MDYQLLFRAPPPPALYVTGRQIFGMKCAAFPGQLQYERHPSVQFMLANALGILYMPQYFFDVRSRDFDYRDPDGITLVDDTSAVAYAERMICELKADGGYDAPDLQMFVRSELQGAIVTIPFNPKPGSAVIETGPRQKND